MVYLLAILIIHNRSIRSTRIIMEINTHLPTMATNLRDRLLFTPDSPLFAKSVSDAGRDFIAVTDFLKGITKTMRSYISELKKLSAIGEQMSGQMRSEYPCFKSDEHAGNIMITATGLADIISDISQSQEILALTLEQSFCEPMDGMCTQELPRVLTMQQQYQLSRDTNDSIVTKYIQSDGHSKSINASILDARAYEIALQKRRFEINRYDMVATLNKLDLKKSLDVSEAFVSTWVLIRAHYNHCSDRFQSSTKYLHELNIRQQNFNDLFHAKFSKPNEARAAILLKMDEFVEKVETSVRSNGGNGDEKWYPGKYIGTIMSSDGKEVPSVKSEDMPPSSSSSSSTSQSALSRLGAIGATFIGLGGKSTATGSAGDTRGSGRPGSPVGIEGDNTLQPEKVTISAATIEEVESRLQVLDKSFIEPLYAVNPLEELAGAIQQGYLWMKNPSGSKLMQPWVRLWFVLDETKLYCIKEGETINAPSEMKVVCDTMLASVREVKSGELPFCFEVAYANVKTFTLQAEGARDHGRWLEAIRLSIERRLTSGSPAPPLIKPSSSSSSLQSSSGGGPESATSLSRSNSSSGATKHPVTSSAAALAAKIAAQQQRRKEMASLISGIIRMNVSCAECGKDSPDWISINLGCVICIECSGVHRSLGVHVSKGDSSVF